MVDEVITKQELIDAQKDAQSLDDFINGGDEQIVITRLLKEYPTLANAIRQIYEKGGKFYPTLADANADIANIRTDVYVITGDNGAYYKATGGATTLTKSPYDPLNQAKDVLKTNATFARSNVTPIAIDTTAKTLTISAGLKISSNLETTFEVVPQTVTIPTSDNAYLLCYDQSSQTASVKTSKTDAEYVLGYVYVAVGVISANFDFNYTIDGQSVFNQRSATLYAAGSAINIDTVANKLNILTGTAQLVGDNINTLIYGTTSITLPESNGFYQLRYNLKTASLSLVALNSTRTYLDVDCGVLQKDDDVFTLHDVPVYAINGKPSKIGGQFGFLATTNPDQIDFNTKTGKLVITNAVRLVVADRGYLMPNTSVDLPTNNSFNILTYDVANGTISIDASNTTLNKNKVIFGQLLVKDGEYFVFGILAYQLNGISSLDKFNSTGAVVVEKDSLKDAEFIVPYGDVEPSYDQPELASYATLVTTNGNDFTKVYDLYDALMVAHPDYITKTLLGNDGQGSPIYQYQFNMLEVDRTNQANTKPKIILVSSVHGYEKVGVYNLYFAMKEICDRWSSDSKLEALKWGVNFLIVPVAVPSGFTLDQRKNHREVDIARNFTAGWVLGDPSSSTYGGKAPLNQPESVILDALMSNNRDAVYFGSCHNFQAKAEGFIWNASGTKFGVNLAKMLCIRETVKSKQRYSWMPQTNDYYIGYSNVGAPSGSEGMQAVETYGINGGTFEICERFLWQEGSPRYSSAVATVGVESLINWILLNVKYGCDLYNSRVNL